LRQPFDQETESGGNFIHEVTRGCDFSLIKPCYDGATLKNFYYYWLIAVTGWMRATLAHAEDMAGLGGVMFSIFATALAWLGLIAGGLFLLRRAKLWKRMAFLFVFLFLPVLLFGVNPF